jgi:hypothetical protein
MAEKIFKVRIPDGYEIDEEKSTFEKIVFKELDYKSLYKTLKGRIQDLHGAGIISDSNYRDLFRKDPPKKKIKSSPKSKITSKSKVKLEEIGDYNTFIGWINNCTSFYQHCYEGYTFPTHDGYEVRDFLPEGLGYKEDGVDIPYNDPEGIDSYFEDWFDDFKEDMGDKFMTYTEYLKQLKK